MAIKFGRKSELHAAEPLKSLNLSALPIDPFEIAKRKDIACQQMLSLGNGISGCMMKVGDNFGVLYSARFTSEGFQNFTVGHELGHYCIDGHVAHLFAGGETLHRSSSRFILSDLYEQEADAFAAGLLMPKDLFGATAAPAGEGLQAIERLAALCRTSLTATAVRFAKLSRTSGGCLFRKGQNPFRCNFAWPEAGTRFHLDKMRCRCARSIAHGILQQGQVQYSPRKSRIRQI